MRKAYPTTLLEFEQWFRSEDACREYLIKLRWPDGFVCPKCGHRQAWRTRRGLLHCGQCRKDTSVTAGTIFHRSHLPLRIWFRAMWHVVTQKSGISALGLQRVLGLRSYRAAWSCLHRLRKAMVRPNREQLAGKIEVDEIVVGGHVKGSGGRMDGNKCWVGVAVEVRGDKIGRLRMAKLPDVRIPQLEAFVLQVAEPGSTIITDGRPAYTGLSRLGFTVIRLSTPYGRPKDEVNRVFPRVHRISALVKRWILGIHQGAVARKYVPAYLDEFVFRFNRRGSPNRGMLFYRLAQQAVSSKPLRISAG